MVNFVNPPDSWKGWRYKENGEIDFSTNDLNYLKARKEFLSQFVYDQDELKNNHKEKFTREAQKLWEEFPTYSNRQVLAWGCGSGKTLKLTVYGALCSDTTLIVLSTNEEVEKLVFDIKALNPDQSVDGYTSSMNIDNVENNIDYFSNTRVLVTNNWRFLNDPSYIFMKCVANENNWYLKFNNKVVGYRSVVIFDELPKLYEEVSVKTSDLTIAMANYPKLTRGLLDNDIPNSLNLTNGAINDLSNILDTDQNFLKLATGSQSLTGSNIERFRRIEKVSKALYSYFLNYKNALSNPYIISWINELETIVSKDAKVIILDATGSILLDGSKLWNVKKDYISTVNIEEVRFLDMEISRNKSKLPLSDHLKKLEEQVDKLKTYLENNSNRKHLIVTWKESKGFSVPELIEKQCKGLNFKVTHYGSGKCRATNEFIDCDSIIFFGDWYVNGDMAEKLSKITKSCITQEDYVLAEMVQAVFRTRARDKSNPNNSILLTLDSRVSRTNNEETGKVDELDLKDRLISELTTGKDLDKMIFTRGMRNAKLEVDSRLYKNLELFVQGYQHLFTSNKLEVDLLDLRNKVPYKNAKKRDYDNLLKVVKKYLGIDVIINTKQ